MLLVIVLALFCAAAQACSPQDPLASRSLSHLELTVFTTWEYDESNVEWHQRTLEDMLEAYILSKGMPYERNSMIQTPLNDRGYFANNYETDFNYPCEQLPVFLKEAKQWYNFIRSFSVKCGSKQYVV